jgi:CRISPR-associated endoribonuclease Cas6
MTPEIYLAGYPILVQDVSYNNIQTKGNLYQIKMLSTITVYSTYEEESGKKKTQFFDPNDPGFSILIEKMFKRYEAYYRMALDTRSFSITSAEIHLRDKRVTYYRNFIINAWEGTYEVQVPQN